MFDALPSQLSQGVFGVGFEPLCPTQAGLIGHAVVGFLKPCELSKTMGGFEYLVAIAGCVGLRRSLTTVGLFETVT